MNRATCVNKNESQKHNNERKSELQKVTEHYTPPCKTIYHFSDCVTI